MLLKAVFVSYLCDCDFADDSKIQDKTVKIAGLVFHSDSKKTLNL